MKSTFSISQVILIPVLLFFLLLFMAVVLLLAGISGISEDESFGYFMTGFGGVFLFMWFWAVRYYLLTFNRISLSENGIKISGLIRSKYWNWSDVKEINLVGNENEVFMFYSMPMEALSFKDMDDNKVILFTKYYNNMDRIRTALHLVDLKLKKGHEVTKDCFQKVERKIVKIDDSSLRKIDDSVLFSTNGLIAIFLFLGGTYILLSTDKPVSWTSICFLLMFFLIYSFGFMGYQLHYFKINEEYLVVKNHLWWWVNDVYQIKDIRAISFEEPHKLSTSIRILTTNYESKLYPAGSLKKKTWSKFHKELSKMGLDAKNEAYFD